MADSAGVKPLLPTALADRILGPAGAARLGVAQTVLGLAVYLAYSLLQAIEVSFGMIDPIESAWLAGTYLIGGSLFYALVRGRIAARWGLDPSLARAQMVFGVACSLWSYAITGAARGAVLTVLMLLIVFSMFTLRAREVRTMAALSLIGLAAIMVWRTYGPSPRYRVGEEIIHFTFAAILLAGVAVLSVQMGQLRSSLSRQKRELEQALEQIRLLATRDELTGLVNRRHMGALLREEQERQARLALPMCLVLIDIDLFKRINDTHGHAAGDLVLRRFADAAMAVVRSVDVLARWGGEEFLLMLPATDVDAARDVVQRIRDSLDRVDFDDIAARFTVTFSAGLACCEAKESVDAAIDRADQAMYSAKTSGRNCTRVA